MSYFRGTVMFFSLALALHAAEDPSALTPAPAKSFDPAKHAWAKFGVGSWVTAKNVMVAGKERKEQVMTFVLSEVTAKDCIVIVYEGDSESKKETGAERFALTPPEGVLNRIVGRAAPAPPKAIGTEKIQAAGQTFSCTIYEFGQGDENVQQVALTDAGLRVRRVSGAKKNGKLVEPDTELLVKTGEPLKLAGKVLECARYEQNDKTLGERYTAWESEAIPGGLVRSELISKGDDGKEVKNSVEVVAWKCVEKK